jgi:hypothetical protein
MIRGSTRCRWLYPLKTHLSQIERFHKHVDHSNRVALVNEIIKAFGNSVDCPRSACSTKRLISFPRRITREPWQTSSVFTQPASFTVHADFYLSLPIHPEQRT